MKVYSCYFGNGRFFAMAKALEASIRANAPEVAATIECVQAPAEISTRTANTEKLRYWFRAVLDLRDGERLVLLDGDMIVRRPLAPAFDEFTTPIAMTVKQMRPSRMRYNCGVVFVRGGAVARAFFERWTTENDLLFHNRDLHIPYESRHGGMNQAAFGKMREDNAPELAHVTDLLCEKWNACDPHSWNHAALLASIVHYKSDLRQAIWSHGSRYLDLVAEWRHYQELSQCLA